MRIVFMGTPDFAASILQAVAQWPEGDIVAVYTQPDRPAGRGKKPREPQSKVLATKLGIPVFQPEHFRAEADVNTLRELRPDVLVVAAYGLLLPQKVLDIPTLGAFNVHASLLPQYRGAAPIQRAIMNGDAISGVTIMRMEAGLDTGPILLQQAVSIQPDDTSGTLFDLLAEHGAKLMVGALGMIKESRAAFTPQNNELATHAPKISKDEEYVDWSKNAADVHNQIRGLSPFPGARTDFAPRQNAKNTGHADILSLRLEPGMVEEALPLQAPSATPDTTANTTPKDEAGAAPGTVLGFDGTCLRIACGQGVYRIQQLRPAGKNTMSATDFRNGRLRGMDAPYGTLGRHAK